MEDHSNRTRLAKLLRFYSSNADTEQTSLSDYLERMKDKQEHIYFMAGSTRGEVEASPFVERLLKKGYEVIIAVEKNNISDIKIEFRKIWVPLNNILNYYVHQSL